MARCYVCFIITPQTLLVGYDLLGERTEEYPAMFHTITHRRYILSTHSCPVWLGPHPQKTNFLPIHPCPQLYPTEDRLTPHNISAHRSFPTLCQSLTTGPQLQVQALPLQLRAGNRLIGNAGRRCTHSPDGE